MRYQYRLFSLFGPILCLLIVPTAVGSQNVVELSAETLQDKVRGGLLGQLLGDLNGLKHEMKYISEPGKVAHYTPALPEGAWTDDDTDIEWVYVVEMQRSNTLLLTPQRIAQLWRRHINRAIWCSNLYVRQLMDLGIEPPLTGHVQFNPWADFNLSGQFLSETWGLISPGMPQTAARMGIHYTRVGIDLEPAQSTQLFTAMVATAFLTGNMEEILDAGVAAVDSKSEMCRIVADVRRWYQQNPEDWQATRKLIQQNYCRYGGHDMRDRNGVQVNGASTIAALLYGQEDFVETVRHAFNFGWDCDNNAAMSGTIVGVIKGNQWMRDQGWKIRDLFRNTSRDEMPADETITRFGDRLVALAQRVITEKGGTSADSGGKGVYRIPVERPANILGLENPDQQLALLRTRMKAEIANGITNGVTSQQRARSAYLAVCLDLVQVLQKEYPQQWTKALATLNDYPKLLQVLFFESPIPAGERLREKAIAAGLKEPARKENIW